MKSIGRDVQVNRDMAIFITMSPGYASKPSLVLSPKSTKISVGQIVVIFCSLGA